MFLRMGHFFVFFWLILQIQVPPIFKKFGQLKQHQKICNFLHFKSHNNNLHGGACGAMVIVVGNGYDDMSSNPGQDRLHFT